MAEAGADQVVVSSEVAEQLRPEMPVRELGPRPLRGVPGEWRLYEVAGEPLG
jgi:class 3 adenylate cyclase